MAERRESRERSESRQSLAKRESWGGWRRRSGLGSLASHVRATPEPSEVLVKRIMQAAQRPPPELLESTEAQASRDGGGSARVEHRGGAAHATCVRPRKQPPARFWSGLALIRSLLTELLWQHLARLLSPLLTSRNTRRRHGQPRRRS